MTPESRRAATPTHTLTITIPLTLLDVESLDYEPVRDAIALALSISRLAVDGISDGLADVSLTDAAKETW